MFLSNLSILSVPDEGFSNLLILSVPDEGFSNLLILSVPDESFSNLLILSVSDEGYSNLSILSVPAEGYSNLLILSVPDEGYFERNWWRFFQKRIVRNKFDIYVFIQTNMSSVLIIAALSDLASTFLVLCLQCKTIETKTTNNYINE